MRVKVRILPGVLGRSHMWGERLWQSGRSIVTLVRMNGGGRSRLNEFVVRVNSVAQKH